ncbi:hypothetical protein B0H14DRAFT_3576720 [Mycena olivaceomarginata]|nr:hypothetical protein B0H14DRAFT_3576720 [Mycena olivaceomarginata]
MYHHIQSNGDLTGLKWGGQVDRNVEDFIPGRKLWKIESSRSSLGGMRTDETVERQQDGKIRQRENKSAKLKSIEDEVGEVEPDTQANSCAAQGSNNSSCPNSSENGHLDIVRFLVENGADVNGKYDKKTPLDMAAENRHTEIVSFLRTHGGVRGKK